MSDKPSKWELVSWEIFYDMARQLAFMIQDDHYPPDIIIAIARGGYTPARILSDYLGVMDMTSFKVKHYRAAHRQPEARIEHPLAADVNGQRILLVDDVSDSGDTFDVAIKHIHEIASPAEIKTAVLHHKIVSHYTPDYFTREVKEWHWITYPWAAMEDITEFIKNMEPAATSHEDVAQKLRADYEMEVPTQLLQDAMKLNRLNIWGS
ncbi:MAG: phosphoribosyltransferase [Gammaproteobacteria bacterium]|nr:phosphoribosyltransferase [Gammaproteobacteria bacterium]